MPEPAATRSRIVALIERVLAAAPHRVACSPAERAAQGVVEPDLAALGFETSYRPFRYNRSLYAAVFVHFGLATAGLLVFYWLPWVAAALQILAGVSYFGDSTRRFYWLRRLLPYRPSQNLVAIAPARAPLRRRVVLLGHIDAAYTGWAFSPTLLHAFAHPTGLGRLLYKGLRAATVGCFALAAVAVLAAFVGTHHWWLWLLMAPFAFVVVTTALLNAQIVWLDDVVPGVDDNLSGVAGCIEVARRVLAEKPDDVELVVGITGCEEAGTGGALALAREAAAGAWDRATTTIIALDSIANGALSYWQEGEIITWPVPARLAALVRAVAARHPDNGPVPMWDMPEGATDATPFLAQGYEAIGFGCIERDVNTPGDYHVDADTLANLDLDQLERSIAFVSDYVRAAWSDA
jgi:hypothetical protein